MNYYKKMVTEESSICSKCGYKSEKNKEKFGLPLCNICFLFAPNNPEEFDNYIEEKISFECLEPFRKYSDLSENRNKKGMIKKALLGKLMTRPPFGYKLEKKKLIPAQNYHEVEEIFEEFLNGKFSLTKIAKKHNFSVNGIKKILMNFTYVGKIKFNGQIHQGEHQPLISSTLFNHVQNKFEKLGIKRI